MNILTADCNEALARCRKAEAWEYVIGKAAEYPLITLAVVGVVALIVTVAIKRSRNNKKVEA